jgi:hypothetical protein
MQARPAIEADNFQALDAPFMIRCFYVFAGLALLSIAISAGGKAIGRSLSLAGHTDDTTVHEIVIGNDVLAVPANAIRFERSRRDGEASRLDLYLRWPDMSGYSRDARDDFNHANGSRNILFLSFAERMMSRDMSARLDPIYRALIEEPGQLLEGGMSEYRLSEKSGYLDERLLVAQRADAEPFVARCLAGASARESLAPCERDLHVGEELSLSYRFPRELLPAWRSLDAAVLAKAGEYLRTGR